MSKRDLDLKQIPPGKRPASDDHLLPAPARKAPEGAPGDPEEESGAPDTQQPVEPKGKCDYEVAA